MIYHPTTPLEAVTLRKQNADTAVYLAGGTDDLRLNGSAPGKDLIDISALGLDDIFVQDGKLYIGARCTFNQVITRQRLSARIFFPHTQIILHRQYPCFSISQPAIRKKDGVAY